MTFDLPISGELDWDAKLNAAVEAAGSDANIASKISDSASATRVALSSAYARVAGVAPATSVQATDTASIASAIASLPTGGVAGFGGTVHLPPGQWLINAPLSLLTGLKFQGSGKNATEIRVQSGNMFAPTTAIGGVKFADLTLSTVSGHLFEFGTTGGLYESEFTNCVLTSYVNGASLMHLSGTGSFIEVMFNGCEFNRTAGSTVSPFDLASSAGSINANEWANCRAVGNGCTSTPFWRLEGTLGSYAHDNTFRRIVGENNRGGLVHAYSPNGATFEGVVDWDPTGNYVDHIVKVATSATAGGKAPRNIRASNVGTRFGTLNAGIHHFDCPAVPGNPVVLDRIGDTTGIGAIPYIIGQSVRDSWGTSGSVNFVGTSYAADINLDGTIVANGVGLTVSLPLPSTVYVGRKFTVKNTNASALTVNSTGGANVDGAASQALAQWVAKTYLTDGSAWFSV